RPDHSDVILACRSAVVLGERGETERTILLDSGARAQDLGALGESPENDEGSVRGLASHQHFSRGRVNGNRGTRSAAATGQAKGQAGQGNHQEEDAPKPGKKLRLPGALSLGLLFAGVGLHAILLQPPWEREPSTWPNGAESASLRSRTLSSRE